MKYKRNKKVKGVMTQEGNKKILLRIVLFGKTTHEIDRK